nr:MAG TPA: hypothetical protein [Caudoviricetes sp.]
MGSQNNRQSSIGFFYYILFTYLCQFFTSFLFYIGLMCDIFYIETSVFVAFTYLLFAE